MAAELTPNRGVLYTNHKKNQPKHPDLQGMYMLEDGTTIKLSGWYKQTPRGTLVSLALDNFVPKARSTNNDYPKEVNAPSEDDIPF